MAKITAAQLVKLPTYATYDRKVHGEIEDGSVEDIWYYVTKYFGYTDHFVLDAEDLDNPWGFGFVFTAYYPTAQDAMSNSSQSQRYSSFYAEKDGEECSIPIRWNIVVGKKAQKWLRANT